MRALRNLNSRNFAPCWGNTQQITAAANARVLAVDRPGYGESTTHPGRGYRDFAQDVDELATYLRLEKYAVCGYSSGGPHAIACAVLNLNNRVAAAGLVSSDAPYTAMGGGMRKRLFGVDDDVEMDMEWARAHASRSAAAIHKRLVG